MESFNDICLLAVNEYGSTSKSIYNISVAGGLCLQRFFCILMNMYGIMKLNVGGVNTCSRLLITQIMMTLR